MHGVDEGDLERVGGHGVDVAEGGGVHAHALELRAVLAPLVRAGAAEEPVGDHVGHVVAGGDQARAHPVEGGALADRPDVRIGGLAALAHDDASALADGEAGLAADPVAGADAGGEDDDVGGQLAAVGQLRGADRAVLGGTEGGRAHAGADLDALVLDEQPQHLAAAVVELDGHESVRELDHGGVRAEVLQRGRGLEAEHAAADDDAADLAAQRLAALGDPGGEGLDVVDRAIAEGAGKVLALGAGRPGPGAGGEHEPVVLVHGAGGAGDGVRGAVQALGGVARDQRDPRVGPDPGVQGEHLGAAVAEPVREVHAVVGLLGLLADHGEGPVAGGVLGLHPGREAVPGHAAADHDDAGARRQRRPGGGGEGGMAGGVHGCAHGPLWSG